MNLKETKEGVILTIVVKPNAKENAIEDISAERVVISISEPPVKGRANKELVRFLRKIFGVKEIEIIRGEKSRNKVVLIKGLSSEDVKKALEKHWKGQ